ncbi:uncharacterized protein LOC143184154 [Calliopsis andreniformis]|uniref:uncharacterized protein LOC143184154 n=1 Tax=Calliopsis andreniformis TaxID=337506 RepID=UPI003FCD5724
MSECFAEGLTMRAMEEEDRWMYCYFQKLASLYRKTPCLWKKDNKHYLDIDHRHRAYDRIHKEIALPGVTVVEIVLRIRQMRRLYVEELKRLLEAKSSGYCYRISFPWFYDLHRFLYPYLDYDEAVELHENCHEFTICGLRESSTSDSCGTNSDHYGAFSTAITHCLRKLDKPLALKAQAEIQRILTSHVDESKVLFEILLLLQLTTSSTVLSYYFIDQKKGTTVT